MGEPSTVPVFSSVFPLGGMAVSNSWLVGSERQSFL